MGVADFDGLPKSGFPLAIAKYMDWKIISNPCFVEPSKRWLPAKGGDGLHTIGDEDDSFQLELPPRNDPTAIYECVFTLCIQSFLGRKNLKRNY